MYLRNDGLRAGERKQRFMRTIGLVFWVVLSVSWVSNAEAGDRLAPSGPDPDRGTDLQTGDTTVPKRDANLETAFTNASPFANEAERQGITVTKDEVDARARVYRDLYPGKMLDDYKVKQMLLAEKYLDSKGSRPALGTGGVAVPDAAERILTFQDLIGREDIRQEGRRLEDIARIKQVSEMKATALWPIEDVQIRDESSDCLAWTGSDCFVTTEEFNAAAARHRIQASVSMDTAKAAVLKWYMLKKELAETVRKSDVEINEDSILGVQKLMLESSQWIRKAGAFGVPVQDPQTLRYLYGKYYGEYFAAAERVTLGVIGSSDSGLVDSLYRVWRSWADRKQKPRSKGVDTTREPALPWIEFRDRDLPEELLVASDTLREGMACAPFRSRAGYFIVKLMKLTPRKEIPFDDAVPCLIFLATRLKYLEMDSVLEAQSRKYYREHKSDYALPDTLKLFGWLQPRFPESRETSKKRKRTAAPIIDTARIAGLALSSLVLPDDTRKRIESLARADTQKTFFGPLPGKYGTWHFRVRSRKSAHDTIPYRLARRDIVEKLTAPPDDISLGLANEESWDKVLLTLGLAMAARRAELLRAPVPQDRRVQRAAPPGLRPGSSAEEKAHYFSAVRDSVQKVRADRARKDAEFLESARIDYPKLLQNP